MKKTKHIFLRWLAVVVFLLVCVTPVIGMRLGYGGDSTLDRPSLIVANEEDTSVNLDFPSQFDDYFAEHFGFREEIITAGAIMQYKLLGESSSDRVVAGKDGWLYFSETTDDYTGESAMSERAIFRLAHTIELMSDYTAQYGITTVFFVAPNKNSIYPEFMPFFVRSSNTQSNLDRLSDQLSRCKSYIDMKSVLLDCKAESELAIYHKLDSHWNNLGALEVFRTIEASLNARISGFDYEDYSGDTRITEVEWSGDLSAMLYPGLDISDVQYDLGVKQNYTSAKPLTDDMALEIATVCQGRYYSAICYRDSFFNSLIGPVANAFCRTRFTRELPYNLNDAVDDEYNVAIIEIVERNLELIIQNAPVMYAPVRTAPGTIEEIDESVSADVIDAGDYIAIHGTLCGQFTPDTRDLIYIEMRGKSGSYFFEAFPIAEDEALNDNGFSSMISKHTLPSDTYTIYVHICANESSRCVQLVTAAQPEQ